MIIPRTSTSKAYPPFIRKSKLVKKYFKQKKVFQKIGLKNCVEELADGTRLIFSSDGNKGMYDIATMSMRGIKSCQSWDHRYSKSLIGSMVDPYAGIIYIENDKGIMISRAVVRFVLSYGLKIPCILIERMYGHIQYNIFTSFLEIKTGSKFPIYYAPNNTDIRYDYFIPSSSPVNKTSRKSLSYRDSNLRYEKVGFRLSKKYMVS